LGVLVLVATLSGCASTGESRAGRQADDPVAPGSAPAAVAPLVWSGCGSGLECATLTVPVDHDRPEGPTLDLAVVRRPATDADQRIGSLVVNPGGPGGSGVEFLRAGPFNDAVAARFDVVSWDPRGVGDSRPLACDGPLPAYLALDWTPEADTERKALDDGARALAEGCRAAAGGLADHVTTRDSARDLDLLRQALGEEHLTYVGFSYGTALGLTYRDLFPARTRAMVLDGLADPREDLRTFLSGQAQALEAQVERALGPGLADYDRLAADAEAGRGPVDSTTLTYAAIAASYAPGGGAALAAALAAGVRGDGQGLHRLADSYWSSAEYGVYAAVTCSDQSHPQGPRGFDAVAADLARAAPRFGETMANELRMCAWWPANAPAPAVAPGPDPTPVLLLGNTGDVATPYATAQKVAGSLGASGVLVTQEGEGHTSLGLSTCLNGHVRRYLEDLVAPAEGTRCR
jgi:pimeloyl-ACP methyl ester carboxylesterase